MATEYTGKDPESPYRNQSGVLLNRFGITDSQLLRDLEYDFSAINQTALLDGTTPIPMEDHGVERLQFIHRELFKDVYEWAGKERTVGFSKAHPSLDEHVGVFASPDDFPQLREVLNEKTAAFVNGSGSKEEAAVDLTEIYAVMNDYHPFPEGNGRATQTFMRLLARERGFDLDFTKVDPTEFKEAAYQTVTHGAVTEVDGERFLDEDSRNLTPMRQIFERVMTPWVKDYQPTAQDAEIKSLMDKRAADALADAGYDATDPSFIEGLDKAIQERRARQASKGESGGQETAQSYVPQARGRSR